MIIWHAIKCRVVVSEIPSLNDLLDSKLNSFDIDKNDDEEQELLLRQNLFKVWKQWKFQAEIVKSKRNTLEKFIWVKNTDINEKIKKFVT